MIAAVTGRDASYEYALAVQHALSAAVVVVCILEVAEATWNVTHLRHQPDAALPDGAGAALLGRSVSS